jgi:branched-chain amino acid transport system permease protein
LPNASDDRVTSVRRRSSGPLVTRILFAAGAILLLAYPWMVPTSYLRYAGVLVLMYAALSTSWSLVGGFTGYVSLGHAAFFGLGAYATGLGVTRLELNHFIALLLAAVGVVLFAVVIGLAAVRVRGSSFVIVSIALVAMLSLLAQQWRSLTGGSRGLRVPVLSESLSRTENHLLFYNLFAVLLALALLTWWFIDRSRFGAGLKAIREDEDKAEALGVPTTVYKVTAFALSAGFTALAGGLYGMWFRNLDPIFIFSIIIGVNMVLMALLGGVRNLLGPLLGALIVAPSAEYFLLRYGETQLHIVLSGAILAVVVLFMPDGIIPAIKKLFARFQPEAASIREESQEQMRDDRQGLSQ